MNALPQGMAWWRRWRECRWQRRREWVLRAMRRHPTEEFTAFELVALARLGVGPDYSVIYRLEREGAITARWVALDEGRRRLYRLAEFGTPGGS